MNDKYKKYKKENYISESLQIKLNIMMVRLFFLLCNQIKFSLFPKQKENCHQEPILFNLNGIGNVSPGVLQSTH